MSPSIGGSYFVTGERVTRVAKVEWCPSTLPGASNHSPFASFRLWRRDARSVGEVREWKLAAMGEGAKHLGWCGHCLGPTAVGKVSRPGLFGAGMGSGGVRLPAAGALTAWSHCGRMEEIRGTGYHGHLLQVRDIEGRD